LSRGCGICCTPSKSKEQEVSSCPGTVTTTSRWRVRDVHDKVGNDAVSQQAPRSAAIPVRLEQGQDLACAVQVGLPVALPKVNQLEIHKEQHRGQDHIPVRRRVVQREPQVLQGALLGAEPVEEAAAGQVGCGAEVLELSSEACVTAEQED